MADEFNLNETTEETVEPKKRGRKSTKTKEVKSEPQTMEISDTVEQKVDSEVTEPEIIAEDVAQVAEVNDATDSQELETETDKPLINIEDEPEEIEEMPKSEEVFASYIDVIREIVYNLPSVSAPRRIISGRVTLLETDNDFCKVLYIAPGRGTDVGYMPKSRYEMYM